MRVSWTRMTAAQISLARYSLPQNCSAIVVLEDAVDKLLKDIYIELSKIKSDVLIEYRQAYVGPLVVSLVIDDQCTVKFALFLETAMYHCKAFYTALYGFKRNTHCLADGKAGKRI